MEIKREGGEKKRGRIRNRKRHIKEEPISQKEESSCQLLAGRIFLDFTHTHKKDAKPYSTQTLEEFHVEENVPQITRSMPSVHIKKGKFI